MSQIDDFLNDSSPAAPAPSNTAAPAKKVASEIDSFLSDAPSQARGIGGLARDAAAWGLKGAIGLVEAPVGLTDIFTGGRVGKALENEGGAFGFRPKQAREAANDWHSEATKDAQRKFQEAEGIGGKFQTAIQNPSNIVGAVAESLPSMAGGAVAARGLLGATRLGQAGAKATAAAEAAGLSAQASRAAGAAASQRAAAIAGAAGEGIMMAGSQAEAIRQETKDGLLTPGQSAASLGTGALGMAFGYGGAKIGARLGLGDMDTMLAQGGRSAAVREAAERAAAAGNGNPLVAAQAAKSLPRQVIESAIVEGFLEELPQSVSEQIIQNLSLDKPWATGLDDAIVLGTLSGMAMGGAGGAFHAYGQQPAAAAPGAAPSAGPAPTPVPPGAGPDWTTEAGAAGPGAPAAAPIQPTDGNGIPYENTRIVPEWDTQPGVATAPLAGSIDMPEQAREFDTGDLELQQPAPVKPSEAMGLNPAAGALSAAAVQAVDSGASGTMQAAAAQAQAAEQAAKAPAPTKAQAEEIDLADISDPYERAYYESFFADAEDAQIGPEVKTWLQDDTNIPDLDAASSASDEDFLRAMGASDQEITDAIASIASQPSRPQEDAQSLVGAQANEPADAGEGAGAAALTEQGGQVDAGARGEPVANLSGMDRPGVDDAGRGAAAPGARAPETGGQPGTSARAPDAGNAQAAAVGGSGAINDALTETQPNTTPAIAQQAPAAINTGAQDNGTQANQAQQTEAQPAQEPGATGNATAAPAQPANPKQAKALERVGAGKAFFFSKQKAEAFIADNGLTGTHAVEQEGRSFHVRAAAAASSAQGLSPTAAKSGEAARRLEQISAVLSSGGYVQGAELRSINGMTMMRLNDDELGGVPKEAFRSPPSPQQMQAAATAGANTPAKANADAPLSANAEATMDAAPAPKPAPVKPSVKARIEAARQTRADHFATGNIVKSYSGHDRVVSYNPPDEGGNWSVTVQAVVKQGNAWVDVPNERQRTHSTQPGERELRAGPVERGKAPAAGTTAPAAPTTVISATANVQDYLNGKITRAELAAEMERSGLDSKAAQSMIDAFEKSHREEAAAQNPGAKAQDKTNSDQPNERRGVLAKLRDAVAALGEKARRAATERENRLASREVERDLFREIGAMPSMAGKSFESILSAVKERLQAQDASTSLNAIQQGRLARAIHRHLAKTGAALAKQKHRDPQVKADAVGDALAQGYPDGDVPPAEHAAFLGGFEHALAGKTKSTLTGESMAALQAGYEAARTWIGTEDGAAWYEGRPSTRLKNTGVDLRRHWEQAKAQMKAGETDMEKAWAQIESATGRAALFAPYLPEGATPGWTLYVTEMRSNTQTFKKWLMDSNRWFGSMGYRSRQKEADNFKFMLEGSRYPGDEEIKRDRWESDSAYRIATLQEAASSYIEQVKSMLQVLDGAKTVAQASTKLVDAYFLPEARTNAMTPDTYMGGSSFFNKEAGALMNSYSYRFGRAGVWRGTPSEFLKLRFGSDYTQHIVSKETTLALPTKATPLSPPKMDRVAREGLKDHRKGASVTPQQFKETFGFADVGFGKWVGSKQDQDHLNYAYDAFIDLATHFGMAPSNVGFGGRLHFTIGALGRGKHAAHFSPNQPSPEGPVPVINLTNTKGDGTVYHEWIHALDHFLEGDWNSQYKAATVRTALLAPLKHQTATVEYVEKIARDFLVGGSYWSNNKKGDKVDAAIKGLRRYTGSNMPETAYKRNADALGKDYWGNDHELIARAAEAWASDGLGDKRNTYLVNPEWVGDGVATQAKGYRGTPYPTGAERVQFGQVFDALAKSVKWTDGRPSVSVADFTKALPESMGKGEARREELLERKAMEALRDRFQSEIEQASSNAQAVRNQKARDEQEEMDQLAAQALKDLEPAVVDAPATGAVDNGPLSDDDLSALFDEAAAELREESQEQPDRPAPGESLSSLPEALDQSAPAPAPAKKPAAKAPAAAPPKKKPDATAAKLIAEAAKLGVKGIDEALGGLSALFGKPGRLNSFPGGFDEDTYRQAKPHFEASLTAFQDAGKTLKDLFKMLIQQFGDGVKEYAVRFAKDQKLTTSLGSKPSASVQAADSVQQKLAAGESFTWRELFAWSDAAWAGTQAEGAYTPKDAYDAMEAGMNRFLQEGEGRKFNPNVPADIALYNVAELERVTALLPTQTKRTAEQDEFQQFSTVPALAYAANWAAAVNDADTMMEPSAGIGGLAVFAKNAGAKLVLNELSSRRAAVLQDVFPGARVFTENAEQIDNILPADVQPSVVVMNPPFSASAGRMQGQRNTQVGAQHVEQALQRLVDGGRLAAVVGDGMAMDRQAFKDWWKKIQAEYDVRAVIPMDGASYAKYGTTFDNVLLVIDKVKPSGRPVVTTKANTYTELIGLLSEIRNDRPAASLPANTNDAITRDGAESARLDAVQDEQDDADSAGANGEPGDMGAAKPGRKPGVGGRGGRSGGAGRGAGRAGRGGKPGAAGTAAGTDAGRSGADDAGAAGGPDTGADQSGLTIESNESTAGALTDSVFESYQPQRLKVPGAKPHPGPLVQSSAMASVLPPAPTYVPNLPKDTITKGLLSVAQIEAVVYAGQAHSEFLAAAGEAQPERRGFFIGDGTGVGKGREIGGIILDNLRQGRKKAVWMSEKQGLMNDAMRDFAGVGGDKTAIFNQNKTKAEDAIPPGDGVIFTTYSTLRSGALSQAQASKAEADYLKSEYKTGSTHRMLGTNGLEFNIEIERVDVPAGKFTATNLDTGRTGLTAAFAGIVAMNGRKDWKTPPKGAKTAGQSRLDQLVNWLGADYDGVIAFDEAHNAGNAVTVKAERGASQPSAQALAVVELQKRLPKARVVYVSATGATQVSNLSYATRLGLWGPSTPFPSVTSFIAEMTAGGLATMELVARDMKQMGAYIARSLSFEGVSYSRIEHELTPLQQDIYNRMADGWQVTLQNFDKALEVTGATQDGKGGGAAKMAAKSAYWGAQQRFFNQIITSMQMPTVIEQIERDIAAGEAVVLQLVNTNEAQQARALAKRKTEDESTDLEDLDLTPRDQLMQMVQKSFPVVQYETYLDENGKKQQRVVTDSKGNPVINRKAEAMRDALLKDLAEIKVPDGPLELLMNHFGPDVVAEVTGRTQRVVRKPDDKGEMKAKLETRGASAARADADAFMADKKQILIFSDAGGTGFSFHADLDKANQRKRKHYLIQPGWRADKAVQGFGRTHRTNEASAPHYFLASTNIPAQKRFLSAIARRLDQLGALTKGQRDTANQGMFSEKDNLESKYATQAVVQLIEDTQRGAVEGLDFQDFLRQTGLEGIVDEQGQIADDKMPTTRLFLNRMLSLRLDMQNKVFDAFIQRMEEKVDVAVERGEFDGGMQTIRALKTAVASDEVAYTDPRTGAETRLVELELTHPTIDYRFPVGQKGIEWVVNAKSGRVWGKARAGQSTLKSGAVVDRYRLQGTGGTQLKDAPEFAVSAAGAAPYRTITEGEARETWEAERAKRPKTYSETTHMVVGAMLPIWDRLKTSGAIQVARTQTEDGQRLLGMVIPKKNIADVRKRLNISSAASKLAPAEVMARILKGDTGELANGWKLERARVSGDLRIELKAGYLATPAARELTGMGVLHERIQWTDRYFVPVGKDGVPVLQALFASKPLVDLQSPAGTDGAAEGGDVRFSRSTSSAPATSPAARAQAVQAVENTASAIRRGWANGPKVVVAYDMQDERIPERIRQEDMRQRSGGAVGAPEGFYYRGTAYLMASKLKTPNDTARVLFHEALGHHGLRSAFGGQLKPLLQQVVTMRRAQVDAKLKEYGLHGLNNLDRLTAAEEVLAEMAQTTPEIGFVKRAIAAIRTWLRENVPGFQSLALTDAELIRNFILPARRFVEGAPRGPGGGVRIEPTMGAFSRATDQTQTEAFKKWFGDSRVVDAEGKPLRVYHGTNKDIKAFKPGRSGKAVWFAGDAELANQFVAGGRQRMGAKPGKGSAVYPAYLAITSPLDLGGLALSDQVSMPQLLRMAGAASDVDALRAIAKANLADGYAFVAQSNPDPVEYLTRSYQEGKRLSDLLDDPGLISALQEGGVDGLMATEMGAQTFAVLAPGQIKSATGNNGDFNPANPDIRFSRAKMADLKTSALDQIHQTLSHPGKVSLWDKTVGTMRNLAERNPAFKPVFDAAQQHIDDVSMMANEAADAAPRILPRLENWRDLGKKPVSTADNKAIGKALFGGTLEWARGADGKPVRVTDLQAQYAGKTAEQKVSLLQAAGHMDAGLLKMWRGLPIDQFEKLIGSRFDSKMLKAGVVWSDKELADVMGLNAQQVSLYREARAAVDRSIDMTSRADMLRLLGKPYAAMRGAVLDMPTLQDAMDLLTSTLVEDAKADPDASERLMQQHNQVVDRATQARDLMDAGYMPLSRFGQYTLDVVDAAGERQYFGLFESVREANQMALKMRSAFPGANVVQGTMSQQAFKLFQGVTPESLELFGNMLGLDSEGNEAKDKAFQEYLKLTKNNHSALKRLIHRQGIAGYSEDVGRVLAGFVYSNARQAAGALNAGTMEQALLDIPKEQGELKDVALGLRSYISDPQEEGQAVRGMLFAQYLGGSVASAFVNMTQPFAVTMPWLSQFGGITKAGKHLAGALKDMGTRGFQYEASLAKALQAAEDDGVVSPQEIHQLMAQSRGAGSLRSGDGTRTGDARAAVANTWERTKVAWGQPFALAEQLNRRSTFVAAYRMAQENGNASPTEFARRAVLETQFLYSKANKMRWGRGAVGGTLMTFKTYSISYLELMHRTWNAGTPGSPERAAGRRAVGWGLAMLMLMGGAGGLPFMEDLEDLIDALAQLMGYNVSSKQWRKQALEDVMGKELADFMDRGISGLPGSPVDVSGRLGMGNLLPGTGLFQTKQSHVRDMLELAGPAGDLVGRAFSGGARVLRGDLAGAALEISPSAVRNAAKGVDMASTGIYKDTKGYKVLDTTIAEALAKGVGFQPKSVADVQEGASFAQRSKSFYTQTSSEIRAQWAKAIFDKDEAAVQRTRDRLAAWNENNPDQRITIRMPDVWKRVREMGKDRAERIADTAPKALRQKLREDAQEQRG